MKLVNRIGVNLWERYWVSGVDIILNLFPTSFIAGQDLIQTEILSAMHKYSLLNDDFPKYDFPQIINYPKTLPKDTIRTYAHIVKHWYSYDPKLLKKYVSILQNELKDENS